MRRIPIFLLLCWLAAGCDAIFGPEPTATPTPAYDDLLPSPTFDIHPPTPLPAGEVSIGLEGMNNATAAALSAHTEYRPSQPTADASRRPILITIPMPSGEQLNAELWAADGLAPAVILLGSTFEGWSGVPAILRDNGYTAVTVEGGLMGDYGDNIRAIFDVIAVQPNIDPARLFAIGAQTGADAAFVGCARDTRCLGAVLLSPQVSADMEDAIAGYNPRPVLLTASQEESASLRAAERIRQAATGSALLQPFAGAGSGVQILYNRPDMTALIVEFLNTVTGG